MVQISWKMWAVEGGSPFFWLLIMYFGRFCIKKHRTNRQTLFPTPIFAIFSLQKQRDGLDDNHPYAHDTVQKIFKIKTACPIGRSHSKKRCGCIEITLNGNFYGDFYMTQTNRQTKRNETSPTDLTTMKMRSVLHSTKDNRRFVLLNKRKWTKMTMDLRDIWQWIFFSSQPKCGGKR